jgi:alcohol dehydrogenase class IV
VPVPPPAEPRQRLAPPRAEPDGPALLVGPGAVRRLPQVLARWRPGRVLLVASRRAVTSSGVLGLLGDGPVTWYDTVLPNPTWPQAAELVRLVDRCRPAVVVGFGGGSALDTAKIGRLVAHPAPGPVAAGRTPPLRDRPPGLVLVPTTGGSGSEVTRFATVYVDGVRRSVEDAAMLADVAVVDPLLAASCPPPVTYASAFDALSHSVESYWSLRSTPRSRALAWQAARELLAVLADPLDAPSPGQRARLAAAATRAGQAIELTRTTSAHGFSYWLTANRQVPHGLACLLNLVWVLPYNARHLPDACADPRGPAFVAERLRALVTILAGPGGTPESASAALAALIRGAGWPDRLGAYGLAPASLTDFVRTGLGAAGRADNNPVALDPRRVTAAVLTRV